MLIDDLKEVRRLRIQLRQLAEERERLAPSLASPRMDGMPRGGKGAGQEARIDLRTELDRRIVDKSREAMLLEKRARDQMAGMMPNLYSLCIYYYIGAMNVSETMQVMNISRSTLYNWLDALKVWTPMDKVGLDRTRNGVI